MLKPLLFATIAALGNAMFVYGQRGVQPHANPFIFVLGAIIVCGLMFGVSALVFQRGGEAGYLQDNWKIVAISGAGFFFTFVGFFLLYNNYGAAQYALYAVISILTTSFGVDVLVYRESINIYHLAAVALAMAAIALFTYGNAQNTG